MQDYSTHAARLQELAAELEARRERILQTDREGVPADFAEQAAVRENDETKQALRARIDEELPQIRTALQRIQDGTYGVCTSCGAAIESARLDALLFTTTCRHCAR